MTAEEKVKKLTTEPVGSLIVRLAIPTILSMLVTAFYNMADTFFVGKIDTESTAAVGVVFSAMAIIQALGFFFGHGSGNYISRKLGEKEFEDASYMASTGFFSAFIFGAASAIICMLFVEPLVVVLGAVPEIVPQSIDYMRIILVGAPFICSSFVLNNQLRFQGSAVFAMIGIISGAVFNLALDPLLIFGFHMGVQGAAIATVTGQVVSFLVLIFGCSRGGNIKIKFSDFRPSIERYYAIFKGGIPSLLRQGLAAIAGILLNRAAGDYSYATIAGLAIVTRIAMAANSALIGFGQGFQPVCGMNYGAKKYNRVREGYFFCIKYSFVFLTGLAVLIFIFAPQIVTLFRATDAEVIAVGTVALRYQCILLPLSSITVLTNMMLQTMGMAMPASIVSSGRNGWAFIPLIFILPIFLGLTGLEMAQAVADAITVLVCIPIVWPVLQKLGRDGDMSGDSVAQEKL